MRSVGADETDQGRAELWARLLAGEITRVYVASDRPRYALLPHTLGLEAQSGSSHLCDPHTGQRLTDAKIHRTAQQLSDEDRWISGFSWMEWDQPFIARSQVALILRSRSWRLRLRIKALITLLGDVVGGLISRRTEEFSAGTQVGSAFDTAGPSTGPHTAAQYFRQVSEYLQAEHPGKTFVVSAHELRQLRAVRVRLDPEPNPLGLVPVLLQPLQSLRRPPDRRR
jgi:hypothetical protein